MSYNKPQTVKKEGLLLCHECHAVLEVAEGRSGLKCPRCLAPVHVRKPATITYTWALLLTSFILFFPANLLPIMTINYMGSPEHSTIMDGIVYFFKEGSYGLGITILTASILVPLFKVVGISMILLSIHFRWESWLRHKVIMFRFIKFIGRWSMLDIFVIALLTLLVQFEFFASIEVGPAAPYFCGVVISTMLAAERLDTRLMGDMESVSNKKIAGE